MKFCIYMVVCVCMASVLLAEVAAPAVASAATEVDENQDEPAEKQAADSGFERFKTIMDRNPFGRPPPGFNPDAPGGASDMRHGADGGAEAAAAAEASVVEQQIISSVRVSVLNVTPSGKINVGFTDSSVQPPRNYLMEVGEKREGCEWQIVEADPEKLLVKVSKDGVEATLKLGGGSADSDVKKDGEEVAKGAAGPGTVPGMGPRPGMPPPGFRRPPLPGAAGTVPGAAGGAGEGITGLDIARARRQERLKQQQDEAEQRRQAAEQAKQEREQERQERERAAEERKAQLAQLMQIQEELRRQREEKQQAEAERRAAEAAQQQVDPQQVDPQ